MIQALGHPSVAVQSAALAGLAALSDRVHAALDPARQRRLWAAIAGPLAASARPAAQPPTAVQAAAARAAGTLAALPSFVQTQLGAELCHLQC
jgi:hypothetical protein